MPKLSLSIEDLNIIKDSLLYTKLKFEDYQDYPSLEFKNERIQTVIEVIKKVDLLLKNSA